MVVWDGVIGLVFLVKVNKSFYFDSFGGQVNKFLLNQLPKPILIHNYEFQDKRFKIMRLKLFILFLFNWKN